MVDILQEGFPAIPSPDEHKYSFDGPEATREYMRDLVRALTSQFNFQKTDADALAVAVSTPVLTTKGDLLTFGTTETRLGVGANNKVLTADSAQTLGIKWGDGYSPTVNNALSGSVIQMVNYQTGAVSSLSTGFPDDDTIPQNTEGDEVLSLSITPNSTTNELVIIVVVHISKNSGNGGTHIAALFQDSTVDAIAVGATCTAVNNQTPQQITFVHKMAAGTTSSTTFKVRAGAGGVGVANTFNGIAGNRMYGGVYASSITITEFKA